MPPYAYDRLSVVDSSFLAIEGPTTHQHVAAVAIFVGVALFSYAGKLCWGFIADWDLVPDLHDFVLAGEASFEELSGAARGERVVGQGA